MMIPLHPPKPDSEWNGEYSVMISCHCDEYKRRQVYEGHRDWLDGEIRLEMGSTNDFSCVLFARDDLYCGKLTEQLLGKIRRRHDVAGIAMLL